MLLDLNLSWTLEIDYFAVIYFNKFDLCISLNPFRYKKQKRRSCGSAPDMCVQSNINAAVAVTVGAGHVGVGEILLPGPGGELHVHAIVAVGVNGGDVARSQRRHGVNGDVAQVTVEPGDGTSAKRI